MPSPRAFQELSAIEARREQRDRRADEARQAANLSSKQSDILRREELEKARDYAEAPFNPPPALASQILRDFLADVSLGSIASIANTSFEQLSLWLDSPEVTHRLAAMQRTLQRKLHIRALNQSEGFLCAISRSLDQYNELESYLDPTGSPENVKNSLRNRENITKNGHLMLRLVKGLAGDPTPQPPQRHRPRQRKRPAPTQQSELPNPKSTSHPEAHKFPAGPARHRDPLPNTHPAILSGAAPSPSSPSSSLDASMPHGSMPSSNPNPCATCASCRSNCTSRSIPPEHPP